ncbi:MAG: hypothetical protein SGILL_010869 [Bacillariaceae sp.]
MARGVVNGSPLDFTKLLWDSNRTKEYNNYCLGRSDVVVHNDEISNGGSYGAKVIKSETKVPFTGLSVFLSAVMHSKALGDRPEDGYMIFSRSLNVGRAGCHVGKATGVDDSNGNEIILGVNIMRPVPGHPDLTDLISVSQVRASMIPPFLAFRVGMMGVEDFFKNTTEYDALFPRSTVEALQFLLNETGAELILSSTWRMRKDFMQDILECLQSFGVKIDKFYDITDPTMHSERQWEIAKWLDDHRQKGSGGEIVWLALDDENLLDGEANEKHRAHFEGHVVQTISEVGLTMEDGKRGLELWKRQLGSYTSTI